mmetsp:Transcript_14564/g.37199  ORF Transcript_14564/g.37199 Transcript_14564/m.37199 type:complete len:201 (-) Transcript_14564:220-822(-)
MASTLAFPCWTTTKPRSPRPFSTRPSCELPLSTTRLVFPSSRLFPFLSPLETVTHHLLLPSPSRCRSFTESGVCRYRNNCKFAHGGHELRAINRHPNYKTKLCKNFIEAGTCTYGSRCRFLHEQNGAFNGFNAEFLEFLGAAAGDAPIPNPATNDKPPRLAVFVAMTAGEGVKGAVGTGSVKMQASPFVNPWSSPTGLNI